MFKLKWLNAIKQDFSQYYNFLKQYSEYKNCNDSRFKLEWKDRYPCLGDATSFTGFDQHYVYHTAWAARILAREGISHHVDISSDLRFVTLVSAFVKIDFFDCRPANVQLPGLGCHSASILSLPLRDNSVHSLSCMHVLEHIGLGRYGDRIDSTGDTKGAIELSRVLAPNGLLLLALPVGKPRIMFNAHRIYSYEMVLKLFPDLKLLEFALIPNTPWIKKAIPLNLDAKPAEVESLDYGCGCFLFTGR